MAEPLKGKTGVVTGGSRGIGKTLALSLASEATKLSVCSIDGEELMNLKKDLPAEYGAREGRLYLEQVDVRDESSVKSFALNTKNVLGIPDILVVNAGRTDQKHRSLEELPVEVWRDIIDVNLTGSFITLKSFLPLMAEKGGNVIIISSLLGQMGYGKANDGPYCASKFGLQGLLEVAVQEYMDSGLNINALYPGEMVNTGFFSHWSPEERRALPDAEVLLEPFLFLTGLPPGSLSGVSINGKKWRENDAYRKTFIRKGKGNEDPNY